jgi:signal transduction histidine kinase
VTTPSRAHRPRRVDPRRVALGLALALVQVGGSHAAAFRQPDRAAPDAAGVALLLVGPLLLLVPRRPLLTASGALGAAAVYLGLGYVYGPVVLSPAAALVIAVAGGRRLGAWTVAGIGWLVAVLGLGPTDVSGFLFRGLGVAVWVVCVVSVGELVRSRRERAADRAQARAEAERRVAGEERLAIARDLHDGVAHHISLMNMRAGVALHLLRPEAQPGEQAVAEARAALEVVKQASAEALAELRSALGVLRAEGEAAPRDPVPGVEAVEHLVGRWGGAGLEVRLAGTPPGTVAAAVPPPVGQAAYRVVQESLTNVSRHSRAGWARVELALDGGVLRVRVSDPGPPRPGSGDADGGRGLVGMTERLAVLGGTLEAGRRSDGGWVVSGSIPAGEGER